MKLTVWFFGHCVNSKFSEENMKVPTTMVLVQLCVTQQFQN
jgi:hypothetical protein